MSGRLKDALARGDVTAWKREGDNLARYQQADAGLALIDADAAAVQRRLAGSVPCLINSDRLRSSNARGAVKEA